jgi:hypothetical protein
MNTNQKALMESRPARKPLKPRSLGKWTGESQPHRSGPVVAGRHLARRPPQRGRKTA